jgi:hypothetical protein
MQAVAETLRPWSRDGSRGLAGPRIFNSKIFVEIGAAEAEFARMVVPRPGYGSPVTSLSTPRA